MVCDLEKSKQILEDGGYTVVLVCGDRTLTSRERGVAPLLDWIGCGADFKGYSASDKVVGKAAAFLYVLLGIKRLYAQVISAPALEVLGSESIEVSFGQVVENIKNRTGTGICPMESCVLGIDNPRDALLEIKKTRERLMK